MMDVMEYASLSLGRATFQLAVSEADPTTVHVRYLSLSESPGDGQNEFTYDDATSSLSLSLTVRVLPSLPADWATRTGMFSLPIIEGATLEWEGGSNGGASATGNVFTARATYRGYPTHNSGFGRKTATFSLGGMTVSQDFEVFFPKTGKNHPPCTTCPNCSNWFYYWREGTVCSIPTHARWAEAIGEHAHYMGWEEENNPNIYLTDNAATEETELELSAHFNKRITSFRIECTANPTADVKSASQGMPGFAYSVVQVASNESCHCQLELGGKGKGIGCVAATVSHEQCHLDMRTEMLERIEEAIDFLDGDLGQEMPAMQYYKGSFGADSMEYARWWAQYKTLTAYCEDLDERDGDGVMAGSEAEGGMGVFSDSSRQDTYGISTVHSTWGEYRRRGDNEVRARFMEGRDLQDKVHADRDWSDPGCQHENPYGPMK